jgi:hypothetical protein
LADLNWGSPKKQHRAPLLTSRIFIALKLFLANSVPESYLIVLLQIESGKQTLIGKDPWRTNPGHKKALHC